MGKFIDGDKFSKHETEMMCWTILIMSPFALYRMFEILGWAVEMLLP